MKVLFFIIFFVFLSCSENDCKYDTDCKDEKLCIDNSCIKPSDECQTDTDCLNLCGEGLPCRCESNNNEQKVCLYYNPCLNNPCTDKNKTICESTTDNDFYICKCNDKYNEKDNGECEYDCSGVENAHTSNSNDGCACNENYYSNNNICEYDCRDYPFKVVNSTNNACICANNYEDKDGDCQFVCNGFSHVNNSNDGCECNEGYTFTDNDCIYDCSDTFSHVNDTNDDCLCNDKYALENGVCTYVCSDTFITNDDNTGCICISGEHEEDGLCLSDTKIVDCIDNSPGNSVLLNSTIEITWTSENGWPDISNCEWECDENYTKTIDELSCEATH